MRVFTCTPVRFRGDEGFFARESGLFARSLQEVGVESMAVMPGPPIDGDAPDLIRTDPANLRSAQWWKSLQLDGMVLYSWASPRHTPVAQALRDAGVPTLVNMDTSGLVSPRANLTGWLEESLLKLAYSPLAHHQRVLAGIKLLADLVAAPTARRRLRHYEAARRVSVVTPLGVDWVRREATSLNRPDLAEKVAYLPHPQLPAFHYSGNPKERLVITVGRWRKADWGQKNPRLLLQSLVRFLQERPQWCAMIVGDGAPELTDALRIDLSSLGGRLEFIGRLPPTQLPALYGRARIGFWTSRWEGQQGTGAQALCCGCSVVSTGSLPNACFHHYVSGSSGRLAERAAAAELAGTLTREADSWDAGRRDAAAISRRWTAEFHGPHVARRALALLGLTEPDPAAGSTGAAPPPPPGSPGSGQMPPPS